MARDPWLAIEFRHFAALEAIALEGSFRRAAVSLGYSPPAISRQIKVLEESTGCRLLERFPGGKPVVVTPAGEVLLAYVAVVLASVNAAKTAVHALRPSKEVIHHREHVSHDA